MGQNKLLINNLLLSYTMVLPFRLHIYQIIKNQNFGDRKLSPIIIFNSIY
jgi:hypothetical protein